MRGVERCHGVGSPALPLLGTALLSGRRPPTPPAAPPVVPSVSAVSAPPPPGPPPRWAPTASAPQTAEAQPVRVSGARGLPLDVLRRELLRQLGTDLGVTERAVLVNHWMFGRTDTQTWAAVARGAPEVVLNVGGQVVCVSSCRLSGEPMTVVPPGAPKPATPYNRKPKIVAASAPVTAAPMPVAVRPTAIGAASWGPSFVHVPASVPPTRGDRDRPRSPARRRERSPERSPPRRRQRRSPSPPPPARRPSFPLSGPPSRRRPTPNARDGSDRGTRPVRPSTGYSEVSGLPGGRQGRY